MTLKVTKLGIVKAELHVKYTGIRVTNTETCHGGAQVDLLAEDDSVVATFSVGHKLGPGDVLDISGLNGVLPVNLS